MIATDLDGTLLRDDGSLSEFTRSVIETCRALGIKFVIATGRSNALKVAPSEMFDGRITSNGAMAKIGNTVVYDKRIHYETSRPVLAACNQHGIKIAFNAGGTHYANFVMSDYWPWFKSSDFHIVDFAAHEHFAEKLFSPDCTDEDRLYIERLIPKELYTVVTSDTTGDFLQVMHKDATKGKAVLALAEHWKIPASEVVTFGNDYNDIDMLASVRHSVAVENAPDEVKSAASYICGSNEEDGPAKWISENVLKYERNDLRRCCNEMQKHALGGRITPPSVYACVLARRGYSSSRLILLHPPATKILCKT